LSSLKAKGIGGFEPQSLIPGHLRPIWDMESGVWQNE
jgi:hypothetical protein